MHLSFEKGVQRSALSLNNDAVSLLRQGHFRLAKRAFSSSLSLLEPLLTLPSNKENGQPQPKPKARQPEESAQHDRSNKRRRILASNTKTCSTNSSDESKSSSKSVADALLHFDIHVVEDSDLSSMRYTLQYGCSHSVFFAIVLRDQDELSPETSKQQEQTDQHLDATALARQEAVVLYNRAVACILCHEQERILASQQQQQQSADQQDSQWLRVARRSLNKAETVLSVAMEQDSQQQSNASSSTDCWTRVQFMLISGLVLNCLSFLHLECHKPTEANRAMKAVDHLSLVLDQYPTMVFDPSHASPAA